MTLTAQQIDGLLETVKQRFSQNMTRHPNTIRTNVEKKLAAQP